MVTTSPSGNVVVLVPPPLVPVTYVPKSPISNSFGLKKLGGGAVGGGAITCFDSGGAGKRDYRLR